MIEGGSVARLLAVAIQITRSARIGISRNSFWKACAFSRSSRLCRTLIGVSEGLILLDLVEDDDELSASNTDFKAFYDSARRFQTDSTPWYQASEYSYDSIVLRQVRR